MRGLEAHTTAWVDRGQDATPRDDARTGSPHHGLVLEGEVLKKIGAPRWFVTAQVGEWIQHGEMLSKPN